MLTPWGALRAVALADRGLAAAGYGRPTGVVLPAAVLVGWVAVLVALALPPSAGRVGSTAVGIGPASEADRRAPSSVPPTRWSRRRPTGRRVPVVAGTTALVVVALTLVVGATVPTRLARTLPWRWQRTWREATHQGWSSTQTVDDVVAAVRADADITDRVVGSDAVGTAVTDSLRRADRVDRQPESSMRAPDQVTVRLHFDDAVVSGRAAFSDYLVRFSLEADEHGHWHIVRSEGPVASVAVDHGPGARRVIASSPNRSRPTPLRPVTSRQVALAMAPSVTTAARSRAGAVVAWVVGVIGAVAPTAFLGEPAPAWPARAARPAGGGPGGAAARDGAGGHRRVRRRSAPGVGRLAQHRRDPDPPVARPRPRRRSRQPAPAGDRRRRRTGGRRGRGRRRNRPGAARPGRRAHPGALLLGAGSVLLSWLLGALIGAWSTSALRSLVVLLVSLLVTGAVASLLYFAPGLGPCSGSPRGPRCGRSTRSRSTRPSSPPPCPSASGSRPARPGWPCWRSAAVRRRRRVPYPIPASPPPAVEAASPASPAWPRRPPTRSLAVRPPMPSIVKEPP